MTTDDEQTVEDFMFSVANKLIFSELSDDSNYWSEAFDFVTDRLNVYMEELSQSDKLRLIKIRVELVRMGRG